MGRLGFEPKTNRLKAECSTAELATLCAFLHTVANDNIDFREVQALLKNSPETPRGLTELGLEDSKKL